MQKKISLSPVIAGCMKWGTWGAHYSTSQYLHLIEDCIAAGITTFDHADIYGDYTVEEEFGAALKEQPSLRGQMQLISKCGIRRFTPNRPVHRINSYDTSKAHILDSAENSLRLFHTDHLDMLLIHRPDPLMHPDEIAEAFTQLERSGKVLSFGVSNFTPSQVSMIHSRFPVAYNQIEVSVLHPAPFHDGQLDQCIELGITPMAWSPLASGKLHTEDPTEQQLRILAVLDLLSIKYIATHDQLLLAYLRTHPAGIVPVVGTTKIERLRSAWNTRELKLEREEWFMIWRAAAGHEVP